VLAAARTHADDGQQAQPQPGQFPAIGVFAESVVEWDEVVACHALTGDMDYLLHIYVRDLEHFSSFLLDKLLNAAGVADVNSSFVLRTVKDFRALPLSQLE